MAGTATYQSMRMASQARDNEEKKTLERKKALLVLICRHLCDYGYVDTAERLQSEGGAQFSPRTSYSLSVFRAPLE